MKNFRTKVWYDFAMIVTEFSRVSIFLRFAKNGILKSEYPKSVWYWTPQVSLTILTKNLPSRFSCYQTLLTKQYLGKCKKEFGTVIQSRGWHFAGYQWFGKPLLFLKSWAAPWCKMAYHDGDSHRSNHLDIHLWTFSCNLYL